MLSDRRVSGWGVVRIHPWHLAGIFATEGDANACAAKLPEGYLVRRGEGFRKSGDFFWESGKDYAP